MSRVGFEPTTPVFERAKTVYALERAAGHSDRHEITKHENTIVQEDSKWLY
jgi:hypothetical protein